MKKLMFAVMCCLMGVAHADLNVTNGNFQADPDYTANVTNWYDLGLGNFWEGAWALNNTYASPFAEPGCLALCDWQESWAYQSIGVNNAGLTSLKIGYDICSFLDTTEIRDVGVIFSIYAVDNTYAGGADDVDIASAAGATLVGSIEKMYVGLNPGTAFLGEQVTLNIAGTAGQELYLRVANPVAASWTGLDNIQIVPEPTTMLLLGLGGLMFRRRQA
jgi:hypothetical protein